MDKIKVLFVCIHNSARSQMAEAFLNTLGGVKFSAESAGLEPGKINPLVVKSMQETGIDISKNKTKDVFEFLSSGKMFDYVITVCDETSGERCPYFPGSSKRLHWTFEDPSEFTGTETEKLFKIAKVRDAIKLKAEEFIKSNK
jgi:arsenate reductase